ncbi:hypothetical protein EYF80_041658 [Liparis tanakae]|uniref:Uncharacterized protein n=1 Tax=Liparis tanakae TaxID=230148 RepID=A0A4Z2G4S1_9TELE|nr:hypothetical protein EYF80_041658 [Liparis tanakae]
MLANGIVLSRLLVYGSTELNFTSPVTGSRCLLMSSRMESSHVQKPKGFPGMFSCESERHTERSEHSMRYMMQICSMKPLETQQLRYRNVRYA